jgi:hypothetical protein
MTWPSPKVDPNREPLTEEEIQEKLEAFYKVSIPIIRKTMPQLIAEDIVGVQPMQAPAGLMFAIKYMDGRVEEVKLSEVDSYLDRLGVDIESIEEL